MVEGRAARLTTLKHKAKAKLGTVQVLKRKDLTADLMLMWVERPDGYEMFVRDPEGYTLPGYSM